MIVGLARVSVASVIILALRGIDLILLTTVMVSMLVCSVAFPQNDVEFFLERLLYLNCCVFIRLAVAGSAI